MVIKLVKIDQLKPGLEIAKPVLKDGKILVEKGTILTKGLITKLQAFKVPYVLVDEKAKIAAQTDNSQVEWDLPFEGPEAPKPLVTSEEEFSNWTPPLDEPNIERQPIAGLYQKTQRKTGPAQIVFKESYKEGLNLIKDELLNMRTGKSPEFEKLRQWVCMKFDEFLENPLEFFNSLGQTPENYILSHSLNVCLLSIMTAYHLNWNLDKIIEVGIAAVLHDVGMVKVENLVWNKNSKLSKMDLFNIQKHVIYGMDILVESDLDDIFAWVAYQHHERLDGSGYPKGKSGVFSITEYSRLVSVIDVLEGLTSPRIWRPNPLEFEKALVYLKLNAGLLFDKKVVEGLEKALIDLNILNTETLASYLEKPTVALLSHDASLKKSLSFILAKYLLPIQEFSNDETFLENLSQSKPKMLLIEDMNFSSHHSYIDFVAMLRSTGKYPASFPVVLITNKKPDRTEVEKAVKAGISYIILWPQPVKEFLQRLTMVMNKFWGQI